MTLPKPSAAAETAGDQPLILVVEDEFLVRCIAADALRDVGFRVIEADNADEAVAILMAGVSVDLVLSDVRMPGSLDGLELLALTKSTYPEVPVVICSGHLDPGQALARGADGFVAKPYRIDAMVAEVAEKLARKIPAK